MVDVCLSALRSAHGLHLQYKKGNTEQYQDESLSSSAEAW